MPSEVVKASTPRMHLKAASQNMCVLSGFIHVISSPGGYMVVVPLVGNKSHGINLENPAL